jgi:regulator of protease activity HflC (stomatin/prohibitin superfamily)
MLSEKIDKKNLMLIVVGISILIFLLLCFLSLGTVDEGERGVRVTLGKASENIITPGVYCQIPFLSETKIFSVRTIREDRDTETYTKDLQIAKLKISVSYKIRHEEIYNLYKRYGEDYQDKIIWNYLFQAIKDIIGKYNAETLIGERESATKEILSTVQLSTKDSPVEFYSFQLLDISYSKEFELSIENKVIAAQKAKEAENKTQEVKQEAEQKVISAKAEAESMRIRAFALSSNPKLISYEIAKKWDGKLPQFVAGDKSIPFIKLDGNSN